jgi:hypothetical protein
MEQTGWLTPDEFWEQYDSAERLIRASAGELPCYGVSGWSGPIFLGEWDLGSRPPVTVSLVHGSAAGPMIQVWTTGQDPRKTAGLHRLVAQGPPANGSDLVDRQRVLDAAPSDEIRIPIDGARVPFTVWRDSDRWWAAGTHAGYGVMLEGLGISPGSVALEEVHDIGPYLNGSRAQIRTVRGES